MMHFTATLLPLLLILKGSREEDRVRIRGLGASFPAEVYQQWQTNYIADRREHVMLNMTYWPTGSSTGKTTILKHESQFAYAGSDVDFSVSEKKKIQDLVIFPSLAGAIVIAYYLPEMNKSRHLNLTTQQLVGIFNGTIRWWNDTTFDDTNPGVDLPKARIRPVVRADSSGTTETFTKALSYFSPEWKNTYGIFKSGIDKDTWRPYHWRNDTIAYYGQKTAGVAGILTSIRYTIGYLSAADIVGADVGKAYVENKDGNFVPSNGDNVVAAMNQQHKFLHKSSTSSLVMDLYSAPGEHSYPLSSFTYLIIHRTNNKDCRVTAELLRYIEWFFYSEEAKALCISLQMVPVSKPLADTITENILKTVKCNGENAYDLMQKMKNEERIQPDPWTIPLAVLFPLVFLLICSLVAYLLYQKYKIWKMINSNEWDIPIDDILFFYNQKTMSAGRSLFGKSKLSFTSLASEDLNSIEDCDALISQVVQWPGKWKNYTIGIRLLNLKDLKILSQSTKRTLLWIRDNVIHQNVLRFHGLTLVDAERYVVSEYCAKGPMLDILQDEKFNLNNDIKFSLATDIVAGMCYLHSHNIVHGNLKSSCCIIDSRWTVKIADWEYVHLYATLKQKKSPLLAIRANADDVGKYQAAFREFWTAPEIIRADYDLEPCSSCDVYSFSMILQEIFSREDPYSEHADMMNPDDVLKAVVQNNLRPKHAEDTPMRIRQIMEIAWGEEASARPSFEQISKMLKHANPTKKNMLDSMMEAMEEYTIHLEEKVEERTAELTIAKDHMEKMLFASVPHFIATKLVNNEDVGPQEHKSVGLLVFEINNLTTACREHKAETNIGILTALHKDIDEICLRKPDVFKVQLFGDTVICVSGLSKKIGKKHVIRTAGLSLELIQLALNKYQSEDDNLKNIILRCGLHCGPVQSGVLGNAPGNYVIFGDAINKAITLMYTSTAMKIQISENCYKVLQNTGMFQMEKATVITHKDKSTMQTYWLLGKGGMKYEIPDTDHETEGKASSSPRNGIAPVSIV